MSLKSSFIQHLSKNYPNLTAAELDSLISDQLISPFQVHLNQDVLELIKTEVKSYWNLRAWGIKNLSEKYAKKNLRTPNNFSVCTSYDFHVSADRNLELIEINTNAAFLAMGLELYKFHQIKNSIDFSETDLIKMFISELQLADNKAPFSIGILDEKPSEQRLYIEFLIYREMFRRHDISCSIAEVDAFSSSEKFFYNRYTDFFLESDLAKPIREKFNAGTIDLSPHPYDYFLLADKQRLIDWNLQTEAAKPKSLLPVYDVATTDRDLLWNERKQLFFKPKNSFGSKQAYKGSSISRSAFDSTMHDNFIAQKISVPSEIEVEHEGQKIKFKYDLRCFAYQDQLQLIIARLYQGQTTNLRTPGGGFACVVID